MPAEPGRDDRPIMATDFGVKNGWTAAAPDTFEFSVVLGMSSPLILFWREHAG